MTSAEILALTPGRALDTAVAAASGYRPAPVIGFDGQPLAGYDDTPTYSTCTWTVMRLVESQRAKWGVCIVANPEGYDVAVGGGDSVSRSALPHAVCLAFLLLTLSPRPAAPAPPVSVPPRVGFSGGPVGEAPPAPPGVPSPA